MCGFIVVSSPANCNAVSDVLTGLLSIQHRGQDAAGVVTYDDKFKSHKGLGLINEVFKPRHLEQLKAPLALGHVRYPTVGGSELYEVQPFWLDFPIGIAMAYNGNVTNFQELKQNYFTHQTFSSSSDLEAILYVFASKLMKFDQLTAENIDKAIQEVFLKVKGAYSVVGMIAGVGTFAFRDPYGIKPIVFGEKHDEMGTHYAIASESVVLDVTGYTVIHDLPPGHTLWIGEGKEPHIVRHKIKSHKACVFEYIYFARPDSTLDEISVHKARLQLGKALAHAWRKTQLSIDVIIPVPESASTAAQVMAEALGVSYRAGFVKNRYVGRSFIMPNDQERRDCVRHKLNPIREEFEGKDILIVDDSIVRGNTSKQIVKIARQMGARKVYMASYSAPLKNQCPYGIDMAIHNEFVTHDRSDQEID